MRSKEIKGKLDGRQGLFFSPAAQSIEICILLMFDTVHDPRRSQRTVVMTKKQTNKENKEHEISVNQNQLLKHTFTKLNVW